MYSSSLRFQQNELKNHSKGMTEHKNVKGDQTLKLVKVSQYQIFAMIQEWNLGDTTIEAATRATIISKCS